MYDVKEYNGWKNWATWNAALWFNNDKLLYMLSKTAKSGHDMKVLFNTEMDLFKDFENKQNEIENIDWNEVFHGTGDRG